MQVTYREKSLHLSAQEYDKILRLTKLKNVVPCCERTQQQSRLYRKISMYRLKSRKIYDPWLGQKLWRIVRNDRIIIPRKEVNGCIKWYHGQTKGDCARKLVYKIRKTYYGIGKGTIQSWLNSNVEHSRRVPLFTNKAPLKPVKSNAVNERHQLDLVDMSHASDTHNGVTFKYILSVLDVFSRRLWLRPLSDKKAKTVACAVRNLYMEWSFPKIVQTDQGGEFKSDFDMFCSKHNMKHITSSAYHPQSQGKDERSHQTWNKKIRWDAEHYRQFSWVKKLPEYQSIYNNGYHVSIGMTPNECFWSRSHRVSQHASRTSDKASTYTIAHRLKKCKPTEYNVGEKVLVRVSALTAKKAGKLRSKLKKTCVEGSIVKANHSNYRYEIETNLQDQGRKRHWVKVNNITSLTRDLEHQRHKFTSKYYIHYVVIIPIYARLVTD
jgi:transposase InsO family protein